MSAGVATSRVPRGYHGDGAIDHLTLEVIARTSQTSQWTTSRPGVGPRSPRAPDVQTVFEGSICKPTRKSSMKNAETTAKSSKKQQNSGDFYLRNKNKDDVDVLTPIIVRRDDKSERTGLSVARRKTVFLNSGASCRVERRRARGGW